MHRYHPAARRRFGHWFSVYTPEKLQPHDICEVDKLQGIRPPDWHDCGLGCRHVSVPSLARKFQEIFPADVEVRTPTRLYPNAGEVLLTGLMYTPVTDADRAPSPARWW
ncbi:hypothetical protein VTO73DRAFT_7206 [Trametes versicolor]